MRVTRAFARILTGEDVTVPDAEFVYEGADDIPGRPQNIFFVDVLLAANDAYDTMADYAESGDARLIVEVAERVGNRLGFRDGGIGEGGGRGHGSPGRGRR